MHPLFFTLLFYFCTDYLWNLCLQLESIWATGQTQILEKLAENCHVLLMICGAKSLFFTAEPRVLGGFRQETQTHTHTHSHIMAQCHKVSWLCVYVCGLFGWMSVDSGPKLDLNSISNSTGRTKKRLRSGRHKNIILITCYVDKLVSFQERCMHFFNNLSSFIM